MSKAVTTFYVLHGDDELLIEEEADHLRSKLSASPNIGLNTAVLDGTAADVNEILGAALAYPFLADVRLVIVRGLLTHATRKGAGSIGKGIVETLAQQLPQLPDWARLLLIERQRIDDKNKVIQTANGHERGSVRLCLAPKDAAQWILKRTEAVYKTKIEPRAAAALASVTQHDLRSADNELLKLALYVDGARPISEADVALLTPYASEASMFDMVDALAEGRVQVAAALVHRLIDQQEDAFSILGMIVRQFRLLILAKEHLVAGGSPKDLAEALGIHPYPAEKVGRQSRSFTLPQLEQIYRILQDYDARIKTGRIDPVLALDLLAAGLGR
jgi:DNA polymerase-3 subunit delta